jgi:hypothetical protein
MVAAAVAAGVVSAAMEWRSRECKEAISSYRVVCASATAGEHVELPGTSVSRRFLEDLSQPTLGRYLGKVDPRPA